MWQDIIVTLIAITAGAVLGWRWYAARKKPAAPHCASCDAAAPVVKVSSRRS